jgi:hypothetical protein
VTTPFRKRLLTSNIRSMGKDKINTQVRVNQRKNQDSRLRVNYSNVAKGHSDALAATRIPDGPGVHVNFAS